MRNAVILAGGKGERLRPLTETRPKCMVPVLGNPLLSLQLRWLKAFGIEKVVICCGYLHEVVQEHVGNGKQFGLQVEYLIEKEPLGRGGALKAGLRTLACDQELVLALNGDAITNLNLTELEKFHKQLGPIATLVSVPLVSPYGIVDLSENGSHVAGFMEKPQLPYWINAGIYVFSPEILNLLPDVGDHEDTTFPMLSKQGQLCAFKTNCFWKPVDTVKDLSELRQQIETLLFQSFFQAQTQFTPV